VPAAPGLSDVLEGRVGWRRAVRIHKLDHLHVLTAGTPVDDVGGLLAAVKLAAFLNEMRETFAAVICDSPALLAVNDGALVARRADAVLLVYALATTPSRSLARAQGLLETAGAIVPGVVVDDVRGVVSAPHYPYYSGRSGAAPAARS
jgi:Mrp family chromosome partitioning ATPase